VVQSQPVAHVVGEDTGREHSLRDNTREPHARGESVVVVQRVEVAGRTRVPDEVLALQRLREGPLGRAVALLHVLEVRLQSVHEGTPRSIRTLREIRTSLPSSLAKVVSNT